MNPLYFYFRGVNQIELSGETSATIRGCRYNPGMGKAEPSAWGEAITETIELQLEGLGSNILAAILELETWVELAGREPIERDYVYLRFYDGVSYDWRSRVIGGSVSLGGLGVKDRDQGAQVVKLTVKRLNYWAGPKVLAPGYTAGQAEPGGSGAFGNGLESHQDANTQCTVYADGETLEGALISPAEIRITNTSVDALDQFTLVMRITKDRIVDVGYIEGEDLTAGSGITKTTTANAFASGGNYGRFAWNSSSEVLLCLKALAAADLPYYRGALHKAILRLDNTHAYTDLWVCAKVLITGTTTVLAELLWQLSPAGSKYQEIPPVAIPPDLAGYDAYGSVDYAIYVKRVAGGACQLDIDFLYLALAEFIRKLIPISAPAGGAGRTLYDSGIDEKTYFLNASNQMLVTHIGQGQRFWIWPGYHMAIKIFMTGGGAGDFTLHVPMNVAVYYEPRKRIL